MAKSKGARAIETLKRMRGKASEKAGLITGTALTIGGGAVTGYVDARFDNSEGNGLEIAGIPVMPVAGLVMVAAGITDMAGKSSEPVTALGNGIVTAWVASKASEIGTRAKEKGNMFGAYEGPAGELGARNSYTSINGVGRGAYVYP